MPQRLLNRPQLHLLMHLISGTLIMMTIFCDTVIVLESYLSSNDPRNFSD